MQLRHGSVAKRLCGRQLQQRSGIGALGSDGEEPGPACAPSRDAGLEAAGTVGGLVPGEPPRRQTGHRPLRQQRQGGSVGLGRALGSGHV